MKWSKEKPPTKDVSYYNHTICETPFGNFVIEWKGWKETPSYTISLEGQYVDTAFTLQEAKQIANDYLVTLVDRMNQYIKQECLEKTTNIEK